MNARYAILFLPLLAGSLVSAEDKPATATVAPATSEVYDPKAADVLRGKKGQILTVEGTIVRAGANRAGTFRYLNFTQNFKDSLSLVFPVAKNAEFTEEKLKEWEGKKVRATGTVSEFNGALQMTIEKWDQLKKVEEPKPEETK
jgi:hypothetical protein